LELRTLLRLAGLSVVTGESPFFITFSLTPASRPQRLIPSRCHFSQSLQPNVTAAAAVFLRIYAAVWTRHQLPSFISVCLSAACRR